MLALVSLAAVHLTIVLLWWAVVVVNLSTYPPGRVVSLIMKEPTFGIVFQEK